MRPKKRSAGYRELLVRLTTPFLLFVLVPVVVLNIISSRAVRIMEVNESQSILNQLAEGRSTVDTLLKNINTVLPLLQFDPRLLSLEGLRAPLAAQDQYQIWQGMQTVRATDLTTRGLTHVIYYPRADIMVTGGYANTNIREIYGTLYQFGGLDYPAFVNAFSPRKNQTTFYQSAHYVWNGQAYQGMLYGVKLRPGGTAVVLFLVDEVFLGHAFSQLTQRGALVNIYGPDGTLLHGHGDASKVTLPLLAPGTSTLLDTSIFGKDNISAYSVSPYGLRFVSILPRSLALTQVQSLRLLALYLTIATITLTMLYTIFLVAKNSRRIARSLLILSDNCDLSTYNGGDAFHYLNNAMLELLASNTILRQDVRTRTAILRTAFIDKLISDSYEDITELENFARDCDIVLTGKRCFALLIALETERVEQHAHIRQQLLDALRPIEDKGLGILYTNSFNRIWVFGLLDEATSASYREVAEYWIHDAVLPACRMVNISFSCIGSGLYAEVTALQEGYALCREHAATAAIATPEQILWIDALTAPMQHVFEYPAQVEKKLINQIQSGDTEGAHGTLRELFEANLSADALSEGMRQIFLTTLKGTYLKALRGDLIHSFREQIVHLPMHRPSPVVHAYFTDLTNDLCEAFIDQNMKHKTAIRKVDLETYVQQHYSDQNLALGTAAIHFGFSEAYFSQLFKEIMGENFSVYLERVRLTTSQALLAQSVKIDDVATMSGYSSPGSYRRAYKRYFGLSPSRAREVGKSTT